MFQVRKLSLRGDCARDTYGIASVAAPASAPFNTVRRFMACSSLCSWPVRRSDGGAVSSELQFDGPPLLNRPLRFEADDDTLPGLLRGNQRPALAEGLHGQRELVFELEDLARHARVDHFAC